MSINKFFLPKILFIYHTQVHPIAHNRFNFGGFKKEKFFFSVAFHMRQTFISCLRENEGLEIRVSYKTF